MENFTGRKTKIKTAKTKQTKKKTTKQNRPSPKQVTLIISHAVFEQTLPDWTQ